jgi:hypothetical protein
MRLWPAVGVVTTGSIAASFVSRTCHASMNRSRRATLVDDIPLAFRTVSVTLQENAKGTTIELSSDNNASERKRK